MKLARVEESTTAGDTLAHPARTCVRCHAAVTTPFCVACGADLAGASFPLARPSKDAQELMHGVSLGGGGAAGFWTFAHGAPVLGVLFWLFWIPLPPVSLGIMAYLFFNGNRVALQRRRYADPAEFRRVELAWSVAGTILLLPTLLVALVWGLFLLSLLLRSGAAA